MNVSLDQAIEMHAKALKYRAGAKAPRFARDRAHQCEAAGDQNGYDVWQKVASAVEALLATDVAVAKASAAPTPAN
jgi:hypothetical protein